MSDRCVLVVEDDDGLREALCETFRIEGIPVHGAPNGAQALEAIARRPVGLVVTDVQMQPMDGRGLLRRIRQAHPNIPVVLMTAYGTIQQAVDAMREGASDYLVKPFEAGALIQLAREFLTPPADGGMTAADPRMLDAIELARRVALSEATVLISGESGTGKEVFAREIHAASARSAGPMLAINCAAIPESMLEAVLFGHEKGAFTGATAANPGKFELAQGGTLLLDEVSEMDLGLQAKLLRVLQEREVERIGGRRTIALDVRVLATTNRRLREEVAAGRFREDLFYRLNVFPIHIPPLRERPGDILPLTRFLLAKHCRGRRPVPSLSDAAAAALMAHRWPGNVREMENLLQRALILMRGTLLDDADLRFEDDSSAPTRPRIGPDPVGSGEAVATDRLGLAMRENERTLILDALRAGNGNRKEAARRLGIPERTLRYKLARLREAGVSLPPAGVACA